MSARAGERHAAATYFERPLPIALVFGAFVFVTVPLVWLRMTPNDNALLPAFVLAEAIGLGTSHFFLTLAVYLNADDRRYFASSWRLRFLYFGVPLLILLGMAWVEAWPLRAALPMVAPYFYLALRMADFFHVGRQSVGMLQIWKRPVAAHLPAWSRRGENVFFVGMAGLQLQTYALGGHFASDRWYAQLPALLLAGLFVLVAVQYLAPLADRQTRRVAAIALAYFVMQAACAATAAYATWLYLTVLAMHYVEYHVIMAPRCFGRDAGRPSNLLLRKPLLLYALLFAVVLAFEARSLARPRGLPMGLLIHAFDGIFLLHYVLDAFLWRFRTPYYRTTLGPVYFEPRPARAWARTRAPSPQAALAIGALALALWAGAQRIVRSAPDAIASAWIDPLQAQEHTRWGVELARRGELAAARHHLSVAVKHNPHDARLAHWLRQVERAQTAQEVTHREATHVAR